MFQAKVANDAWMINYMPSFNMDSQVYLLVESMVTIIAKIFKVANLYDF